MVSRIETLFLPLDERPCHTQVVSLLYLFLVVFRGFYQIKAGPEAGSFKHGLFRRDKPDLCLEMECKSSSSRPGFSRKLPLGGGVSSATMDAGIVSESDDGNSAGTPGSSRRSSSRKSCSGNDNPFSYISNDKAFVEECLRQRDREERLRVARQELYQNFLAALNQK